MIHKSYLEFEKILFDIVEAFILGSGGVKSVGIATLNTENSDRGLEWRTWFLFEKSNFHSFDSIHAKMQSTHKLDFQAAHSEIIVKSDVVQWSWWIYSQSLNTAENQIEASQDVSHRYKGNRSNTFEFQSHKREELRRWNTVSHVLHTSVPTRHTSHYSRNVRNSG